MSETQVKELLSIGNKADLDKKMKEKPEELKKVLEGVQDHMNTINDDDTITPAERNKAREVLVKLRQLDLDEKKSIETVATTTKANLADLIHDVELFSAYEAENVTDGTANLDTDKKKGVLGKFDAVAKELGISRSKAMIMAQRGWDISQNNKAALGGRYDLAIGPKVIGASVDPKKYIDIYQTWLKDSQSTGSGGSQGGETPLGIKTDEDQTETKTDEKSIEEKKAESLATLNTLLDAHNDKVGDGVAEMIRTQLIDETTGEINEKVYNALDGLFHLPAEAWNGYKLSTGDVGRLIKPEGSGTRLLSGDITWNASKKSIMVPGATSEVGPDPFPGVKELFHDIQKDSHNTPSNADLTTNTQEGMDKKKTKEKYDSVNKELQSIKTDFPWSKFDFTVSDDADSATITRDGQSEVITRKGDYFFTAYSNKPLTLKQAAVMANMSNFTKKYIDEKGDTSIETGSEPFVRDGNGIDFARVGIDQNFITDGGKWQQFYTKQGISTDDMIAILNKCYHDYTGK